jgi:AcrR family transcriptional regulator
MTAIPTTSSPATDKADPRETILKAAGERILHYGYNKTTMSEIAADCGMSAGNIYRFYPSKIDIAEAMTRKFSAASHVIYAGIINDSARSPSAKLANFFNTRLERNFQLFEKNPMLLEVVVFLGRERPDYIAEEWAQERIQIEKILDEGQKSGDFALPDDLTITADLVQCAMMKFRIPHLWTTEQLDSLRIEMEGLLNLIFTGLSARR